MINTAELPTKDIITLIINKKNPDKVTYVFKNRYGNKVGEHVNRPPATLSPQSNAGQVILKNPVSVICLGEASSGKTHIQETALRLIPEKFIVNEKKIPEATLFNRAKK